MSKNHQNHYGISIPADWANPKFHLGLHIQATTLLPDTTRIQTGEISGIEYIKADSLWVTQDKVKPGWYYSIELDLDDPSYCTSPVISLNESDISPLTEAPAQK